MSFGEDLRERFSLGNTPRIFHVQWDIYKIEQGQMSVAAYYTKLKGLWDELASFNSITCTCGAQNDRTKLMRFLMELNESYSGARGQILLMNHLPSVRQAYASVVQVEKQQELRSAITMLSNIAAIVVRGNYNMLGGRQKNQVHGNQSNDSHNKKPFQCTYCGDMYRRKATGYKLIGYPPGHPKSREKARHQRQGNDKHCSNLASGNPSANQVDFNPTFQELQVSLPNLTKDQYVQILSALTSKPVTPQANVASVFKHISGLLPVAHNCWILDSGATHHITSSPTSLMNVDKNPFLAPVSLPS
jgi:hypothetical protein